MQSSQALGQQGRRQRAQAQTLTGKQGAEAVHQVRQLPHIARPLVGAQRLRKIGRKTHLFVALEGKFLGKKIQQQRYIDRALTQRRRADGQHIETVVQVFPKPAGNNLRLQVAVGSGNHPHIDLYRLGTAHRIHHPLLQHPQQLDLQLQRQVTNFIQKNRAIVGQLEAALAVCGSAGESPFAVPEQLALDEVLGYCRTVDGHKVSRRAIGEIMQRACDDFLAGATLAGNQYARA